jgi:hypothetical protein
MVRKVQRKRIIGYPELHTDLSLLKDVDPYKIYDCITAGLLTQTVSYLHTSVPQLGELWEDLRKVLGEELEHCNEDLKLKMREGEKRREHE